MYLLLSMVLAAGTKGLNTHFLLPITVGDSKSIQQVEFETFRGALENHQFTSIYFKLRYCKMN